MMTHMPVSFVSALRTPARASSFTPATLAAALAAVALGAAPLHAQQAWPSKPVTLVITVSPGGSIDNIARFVGDELARSIGQPVLIENRPGAAGSIAAGVVARAAPDGHTYLVSGANTLTLTPFMQKKGDNWVDPLKSFVPVTTTARTNYVLVVGPHVKATTVEEFIAFARAQSGKLSFGSSGSGSLIHLATEIFNDAIGAQATHVPYKGLAPAVQDLMSGRIDYLFDSATTVEQVRGGRLRALAVIGPQSLPALPELRALSTHGVKGMEVVSGWHGWFAPAGTPMEIVNRVSAEVGRIIALPKVRERILSQGAEPMAMGAEAFRQRVNEDIQRFEPILKKLGLAAF
jgi:tripartite-type tricarboxylate transporter receptor subunit TctC